MRCNVAVQGSVGVRQCSLGVMTNGLVVGSPSSSGAAGATATATSPRPASRKGGIIFPSVKNKPIIGNNTFASEIVANYKDVKVSLMLHYRIFLHNLLGYAALYSLGTTTINPYGQHA